MKRIIYMLLALMSWGVAMADDNAELVYSKDGVNFYRYQDIYYMISDYEQKEVMTTDPTHYGMHYFDTWLYCNMDSDVDLPESIPIDGEEYVVTGIDRDCFFGLNKPCKISSTIKTVGRDNFIYCQQPIEWGTGVEIIQKNCIQDCKADTLELPVNLRYLGPNCVNDNTFKHIQIPNGILYIGQESFCRNRNLESVVIPGSVQEVGTGCFFNNPSLKCVTLTSSFNRQPQQAFNECPNIERIELKDVFSMELFKTSFLNIDPEKCILIVPDYYKTWFESSIRDVDAPISKVKIYAKSEEPSSSCDIIYDAHPEVEVGRYSISGVPVDNSYKGLVLIRYADGTTRKVIVR